MGFHESIPVDLDALDVDVDITLDDTLIAVARREHGIEEDERISAP